ncbi:MAG TPA: sugar efflux transporter [Polyangiaceae bacterium]|nr:sugar efflux transporter [Polyangiaceae bacterium]
MTTQDESPAQGLKGRWRTAALDAFGTPAFGGLFACCLVLGLTSSFVIPFLSLWGTLKVGMTPLLFACFMTLNSLAAMAASTLLARYSDTRWSRRTVLLLGGSGGVLGYLGYAFVTRPLWLFGIGVTAMSISSVSFSQIFAHAREQLARSERGGQTASFALGVLRASFSLAWTVGPALGALVVQHFGYRGSFLTASGLLIVYLALVFRFVPGLAPSLPPPTRGAKPEVFGLLTQPLLLANFSAFVLIFSAVSMNMMNLPLFITQVLRGSERQVGTAFAVAPCFEIPLMLWLGRLATRANQALLIRAGVLVGVLYFLALGLAATPEHVYPAQLLNAFTIAVTMSVAIPYFQDLLPGQTGLATSVYTSSWSLGSLIGYLSFGLLAERLGHRGLTGLCAAFGSASLLVLVLTGKRAAAPAPSLAVDG